MALPNRAARVADTVRRALSTLLLREVRDPRIKDVTITDVEVTSDLSLAKVYVHINNDQKEKILTTLQSASGFFRSKLSALIQMRTTPEIRFKIDDSINRYQKIESILEDANRDE